ncbi:MAG: BamA/TamA family outer membrane protein [bacterium]|nr:BamA/TamA family outer membrane protein [bacterium]
MRKNVSVSISGSGKGINFRGLLLLLVLLPAGALSLWGDLKDFSIAKIHIQTRDGSAIKNGRKYMLLLDLKQGDAFSYKKNRKSMANLHKTDQFSNIETEVETHGDNTLDLYYLLTYKYKIRSVKTNKLVGIRKNALQSAVFSLRKGTWFDSANIEPAKDDIRDFLASRGYFKPSISSRVTKEEKTRRVDIRFSTEPGKITSINDLALQVSDNKLLEKLKPYFIDKKYIPYRFQKEIEKVKKLLKQDKFYFPKITVEENFLDDTRSLVDLNVIVQTGYKYVFSFTGINNKIDLIASVWEKKVFEKWAEKESKARILYHLKNKGYLDAKVESVVEVKNQVKFISFYVEKNKKYKLGKVTFTGGETFSREKLKEIVRTDDLFFDRHFRLRGSSLLADRGVLRLFYYYNGFPSTEIFLRPTFHGNRADIDFVIKEGNKYSVDTILFNGNRSIEPKILAGVMATKNEGPFVQQVLNQDIEKLKTYYGTLGFDQVAITPEISDGRKKSILLNITEGPAFKLRNLIIIGASKEQDKLIRRLFPLKKGAFFDRQKIEAFKDEIENSSIFNEVSIVHLEKENNNIDVLVKIIAEKSRYYGFGAGWEERKGLRGTLEYQERNIFSGYSSFSSIFQAGKNELRGIFSYDTPYFFKRKINSELKLWMDKEIYPSYDFERFGIRESLIKKLSSRAYILASGSIYRTRLTALEITPNDVDLLKIPFYTAALNFSYVRENRDNPFNPTSGNFFSSDIRGGLFRFERNLVAEEQLAQGLISEDTFGRFFSFVKLRWSYQRLFKFIKSGTLAFTVKNGLAFGKLPITERFFAGGVNSFRGTKNDRLGPYDIMVVDDTDSAGNIIGSTLHKKPKGGNALLLINLEATFPISIIPGGDFYYSVFFDVGNVFPQVREFRIKDFEKSIGFSLKMKTELGPLRFDFAWKLGKREVFDGSKEGAFVWHVGFGNVL